MKKIKDFIKITIGLEVIVILAFLGCSYAARNGTKRNFHIHLARENRTNQIMCF